MPHRFPFAPRTTPVGAVMARLEREHEATPVSAYKAVLKSVVDNRPSGTRQRLAIALGKNRSFITQISSPAYSVPIPAVHLDTIFEVCHFTATEKSEFLTAYKRAHRRRRRMGRKPAGHRTLTLTMPDLGDAARNRRLEQAIVDVAQGLARLLGRREP
jgi:hypothetical protein